MTDTFQIKTCHFNEMNLMKGIKFVYLDYATRPNQQLTGNTNKAQITTQQSGDCRRKPACTVL